MVTILIAWKMPSNHLFSGNKNHFWTLVARFFPHCMQTFFGRSKTKKTTPNIAICSFCLSKQIFFHCNFETNQSGPFYIRHAFLNRLKIAGIAFMQNAYWHSNQCNGLCMETMLFTETKGSGYRRFNIFCSALKIAV